jgi:DNA primase
VLIAYDRDAAGEQAAEKLATKLQAHGIGCYRVEFPKDMDANEYALKVTPAAHSLGLLLRTAHWLGQGPAPAITSVPEMVNIESSSGIGRCAPGDEDLQRELEDQPRPTPDAERPTGNEAPTPLVAVTEIPVEIRNDEIVIHLGDRKYRVRGLAKNLSYDVLRGNILVAKGDVFHVDTFDLYSARQRALFVRQAAEDLALTEEVIKADVGKVLLTLEELQDEQIRKTLAPQEHAVALSDEDRAAALDLQAILAFMPEEERVKYSAMTGQLHAGLDRQAQGGAHRDTPRRSVSPPDLRRAHRPHRR